MKLSSNKNFSHTNYETITNRLTAKQKRVWRPILIKFYGLICFYCKNEFILQNHEFNITDNYGERLYNNPFHERFDHLNDKEWDNRIENIVLCHNYCNNKKMYDEELKQKGRDQLLKNEKNGVLARLGEGEKKTRTHKDEQEEGEKTRVDNEEIYSNTEFVKITTEYLVEELSTANRLPYKSTVDSITMKCFNEIGHCSQNTIRRIIDMLASNEGRFYKYRDGGKQWISKENPLLDN